jgi:hypothetical protein
MIRLAPRHGKKNHWMTEREASFPLDTDRPRQRRLVVMDTDIGSDIDDALALLLLLHQG